MNLLSPQLQAFFAIAQHKTAHGAAKVLHITQTAVTHRIHILERALRTTLFIRTRRGMHLTAEGETLLRYCQAARELEGEALTIIRGSGIESEINFNITGPTSTMHARIIPACLSIIKKYPHLMIQFNINDVENRLQSLRSGESQMALLRWEDIPSEMESKLLHPENYLLVCSAKWKNRGLKEILQNERIIDYDPADKLTLDYLKHFDLLDFTRPERYFVNRTDSLAMMVSAGYGYSVLTQEFIQTYSHKNQLIMLNRQKVYPQKIALAWYHRPNPPKYFLEILKAIE